ncbi:MAG TPA: hypothetical protein PLG47_05660 [Candidatus Dojkabacteria bacterium]|nr:hypothetical protein [Candidatus Dojkabacteria bacterium]
MSEQNQKMQEPTAEEMKARKAELMAFYKAELPLLRLRKEYEETIAAIEIAKMQTLEIMIAKSQMMNGQQEAQNKKSKEEIKEEVK